ncbi:MAG: energy transducer TonB [Bacteroidales bacterium]
MIPFKKTFLLLAFSLALPGKHFAQEMDPQTGRLVKIRELKNGSFERLEMTDDSLLIFKGTYKSLDPLIRHGRFYYFHPTGYVETTGFFVDDVPHGTWVTYNEERDTLRSLNYGAVWDFMESEAHNFAIDPGILDQLSPQDKQTMNPDGTFYLTDDMPTFLGRNDMTGYQDYIREHMHYPIHAARTGQTGTVILQFLVDTEGKVKDPQFVRHANPDFDMEALRILLEAPDWKPGTIHGLPVHTVHTRPFLFTYEQWKKEDLGWIQKNLEEPPSFEGEEWPLSFRTYIARNLRYPERAAENGITGRVLVEFTVLEDGNLDQVRVKESVDPDLDAEAIRVVRSSPRWEPAKRNGASRPMTLIMPINFVM